MKRIISWYNSWNTRINAFLHRIRIPGTPGMTLYHFASCFKPVLTGNFNTRAASISFKLFLAIFPAIIFLFTIIPYIPVADFQSTLMLVFQEIMPDNVFPIVEKTISDIINIKHSGLLSLGFILTLYFSSNGFISLISAFNQSININETRTWYQQRLVSLLLMVITTLILILAVTLMAVGRETLEWMMAKGIMPIKNIYSLLLIGRWFLLATVIYLTLSIVYYVAPAKRAGFRFFAIGSAVATALTILLAWGFGTFISHFSSYNALYGSVGTILILMLYIYYNASIMLIGFELNASILVMRKENHSMPQEVVSRIV